jgi:hypothetical protein
MKGLAFVKLGITYLLFGTYFVIYVLLGLIKVNQCLIASHDICERSIVVFRELFQQLFGDFYPSMFSVLL